MKTHVISGSIIFIMAIGLVFMNCEAKSGSGNVNKRNSTTQPAEPTEEEEEDAKKEKEEKNTDTGSKYTTGEGNVHNSGNVNDGKNEESRSEESKKTPEPKPNYEQPEEHSKPVIETKTSENSHTGETRSKTEPSTTADDALRKKSDESNASSDSAADGRSKRDIPENPMEKDSKRDYHGANDSSNDEHIGNVREGGNVTRISVRKSEHHIHGDDRWKNPKKNPDVYYYRWGDRWSRLPVAKDHYPRYFYYQNEDNWSRVDRTVVYNDWTYNDYYEEEHVVVSQTAPEPQTSYPEPVTYGYSDFFTKGETEENLIVKTLTLSQEETNRVERLIEAEIIQNILASVAPDEENASENNYEYNPDNHLLIITAPEEIVLKIQAIVQDERTFKEFHSPDEYFAVDVISVVSPVYLEKKYREAAQLGALNMGEIQKYLESLDSQYLSKRKKCWYNESIGTITIVDEEQNIFRAWEYMNKLPYIPKTLVY